MPIQVSQLNGLFGPVFLCLHRHIQFGAFLSNYLSKLTGTVDHSYRQSSFRTRRGQAGMLDYGGVACPAPLAPQRSEGKVSKVGGGGCRSVPNACLTFGEAGRRLVTRKDQCCLQPIHRQVPSRPSCVASPQRATWTHRTRRSQHCWVHHTRGLAKRPSHLDWRD